MDPIDAARIRETSQAAFAEQGYPVPSGSDPDPLDTLIVPAAGKMVLDTTGWDTYEAVPDDKAPLVELAIRLAVEMTAAQSTPEYLETLSDFDLIASFSAGSYSETRRSGDDALKAKMLAAWPPLNQALIAALTDEKRDWYLAWLAGYSPADFSVTEVDWSGRGCYDLWGWTDPFYAWSRNW